MNDVKRERINRLKWQCRRALLELDIVFQRYWARHGDDLDAGSEAALKRLLAYEDHDLWDLVNGRAVVDDPELENCIGVLRKAGFGAGGADFNQLSDDFKPGQEQSI